VQELREQGVCLEDPMIPKTDFIQNASSGNLKGVKEFLSKGEDPNCTNYTGASALLLAAVNKHTNVVEVLFKAGANVNCRDRNLMTPLLFCVSRGHVAVVRQLIGYGASKSVSEYLCVYASLCALVLVIFSPRFNCRSFPLFPVMRSNCCSLRDRVLIVVSCRCPFSRASVRDHVSTALRFAF
jgi:ankyrin repeat protein